MKTNRGTGVPLTRRSGDLRYVIFVLFALLTAGCSTYQYGFDNPRIRSLQAASLENSTNVVAGVSLERFFGARTGWVLEEDTAILQTKPLEPGQVIAVGGRATAVTDDGYYLTARHVIERASPVMVLPPNAIVNGGKRVKIGKQPVTLSRGRVVADFAPLDLALVKFEHRPRAHFKSVNIHPTKGAEVFSAGTDGYIAGEEQIGNGPFKVRGQVIKVKDRRKSAGGKRIITSLVARGGMSGAPVADTGGNLVGIIVAGKWSLLTGRPISSESQMIPHALLHSTIEADR